MPEKKDYCEMCGHRRGLRIAPDADGKRLTLCKLCREGAAALVDLYRETAQQFGHPNTEEHRTSCRECWKYVNAHLK